MKQLFFIFLLFSLIKIQATQQQSDILYFNGEKYYILNRMVSRNIIGEYIDKKNMNYEMNSSLWRGYIAEYQITDDFFSIKDILVATHFSKESFIKLRTTDAEIFDTLSKVSTNTLLIISKENTSIYNLNENFSPVKVLEIKNNKITKTLGLNSYTAYTQFKCDQFTKYTLTEAYKKNYYYSFKTIQNSREKYGYEDKILPIHEEVENFIANLLFEEETFTHIL